MVAEEIALNEHLEALGIAPIETDLGERIQQLDNEPPSHIVVPAVHKLRADVALFRATVLDELVPFDVPPASRAT